MSDGKNTGESQKTAFQDELKKTGRLVPAKSPDKPKGTFIPIETEGKPLSEIIIEERK